MTMAIFWNVKRHQRLVESVKMRLHKASRETSHLVRLPAPSYLPHVKIHLAEIRSKSGSNVRQVDVTCDK
jgi:hypothetical protein